MTQQYAHHYPESLRNGVDVLDVQRPMSTQSAQPPGVPPFTETGWHEHPWWLNEYAPHILSVASACPLPGDTARARSEQPQDGSSRRGPGTGRLMVHEPSFPS